MEGFSNNGPLQKTTGIFVIWWSRGILGWPNISGAQPPCTMMYIPNTSHTSIPSTKWFKICQFCSFIFLGSKTPCPEGYFFSSKKQLVGGFNPLEKYESKWVHRPQVSGLKKIYIWVATNQTQLPWTPFLRTFPPSGQTSPQLNNKSRWQQTHSQCKFAHGIQSCHTVDGPGEWTFFLVGISTLVTFPYAGW